MTLWTRLTTFVLAHVVLISAALALVQTSN